MATILLIEAEPELLHSYQEMLVEEGYEVFAVTDGDSAHHLASSEAPDLIVLDLMLPERPGLEVLAKLRCRFTMPVLTLVAMSQDSHREAGLDEGADDYLLKPFAFDELLSRIQALLRRSSTDKRWILRACDLKLNLRTRQVSQSGCELDLTVREYELLEYFLRHPGKVLPRRTILRDVWREPGPVETNIVDVYVNYLRKKLDGTETSHLIQTVRGVGYRLGEEP